MTFNWKKYDYEATLRIIAYSEGPSFFAIVPFIGGLIATIWKLVLAIIGLREVHNLSTGQAILTVFMPLILSCFCCCGFGFWLFSMIGLSR